MVCLGIKHKRDTFKVMKYLHCFFAVANENETAIITGAKLNPFFCEDA